LLAVAVLILSAIDWAPARGDDTSEARRLFASGTKHFDLSEFDEALEDFKNAYRFKDDPVFLYNIAQCHRLLKHNEDAVRFYKSYLRRAPTSPRRHEVELKIAALEEAIALGQRAQTIPPTSVVSSQGAHGEPHEFGPELSPAVERARAASPPAPAAVTGIGVQASARRETPLYKKWWLWTAVGAVAAIGIGVGVGVGVTQRRSSGTTFPAVSY
jgi:tetratricopeptide (TPR) repeat protein